MCFSATASFGAGIFLSAIGIASIKKAKSRSEILFASIPLIFAVQQITEGFIWLSLSGSIFTSWRHVTTYTFIFFAQVVWPVWIPLSILKLEPKGSRKKTGIFLTGIGIVVSLYMAYCLLTFNVEAQIVGYHISYLQNYPAALGSYGGLLYVVATILPPFFSSVKKMWTLGTAILISYVITNIFYTDYVVSVWCFFASVISIAVYAIMHEINKTPKIIPGMVTNVVIKNGIIQT